MSMIEHAVGVVNLERFAEIYNMDREELGSLLFDVMRENASLKKYIKDRDASLTNIRDKFPTWYVTNPNVLFSEDLPDYICIDKLWYYLII